MTDSEERHTANPGFALDQLARALSTAAEGTDPAARARAEARAARWRQVLEGMFDGSLTVGARTPVAGVPPWVTLEVARGGFATGGLLAGGALEVHELKLIAWLGLRPSDSRAALNAHFLGEEGSRELVAMLESGCYRIRLPEEGALLAFAWLQERGAFEEAASLLDEIVGLFDRLRFYPVPDPRPLTARPVVHLRTVGETIRDLERVEVPPQVERMNEALRVWNPLSDRAVSLFLETVEDGWPCRVYPAGWTARARTLLDDHARAREAHPFCGKPDRPRENFARLRGYLARILVEPESLTGRDVGDIRRILTAVAAKRGVPGSPGHRQLRDVQARQAASPTRREHSRAIVEHLRAFPSDGGLPEDLEPELAARPAGLRAKVDRCLEAPIEVLVEKGVIGSSEVLAQVSPQLTSQVVAAGAQDVPGQRLLRALYAAFRRRRSLLLLDLERQVRFTELPWGAALERRVVVTETAKAAALRSLEELVCLAIESFPHVILPNKFLQEVRALAQKAGLDLPLTDELAADIFMGRFTPNFVLAAKVAARVLGGTLYERYYGLPSARVRGLAPDDGPSFASLCGGGRGARFSVAANGMVIERQQILCTHNLAPLFEALGLARRLDLSEIARRSFEWILRILQREAPARRTRLQNVKNAAYAWRQMVFYLSFLTPEEVDVFAAWTGARIAEEPADFARRFSPAIVGLGLVASGLDFDLEGRRGAGIRFLGWADGSHWLLDVS